jgi:hypothetical protein
MEACCNLGLTPNIAQKRDRSPSPQQESKKTRLPDSDPESEEEEEEDAGPTWNTEELAELEEKTFDYYANESLILRGMNPDLVKVVQTIVTLSNNIRRQIQAHNCTTKQTKSHNKEQRKIREAVEKQNIAIKALAAQVASRITAQPPAAVEEIRTRSLAKQHQSTPTESPKSYKEAVQSHKKTPTLQVAQSKARIVIQPKTDESMDKTKILETIRKHAKNNDLKADFTILNNTGPNLMITPDNPTETEAIRQALSNCLAEQDCKVASPLIPRLIIFNIDPDTSTEAILKAISDKCEQANPTLHKVHEVPGRKEYHAFVDVSQASLKTLFTDGDYRTKIKANWSIFNMEIAKSVKICFNCGKFGHLACW